MSHHRAHSHAHATADAAARDAELAPGRQNRAAQLAAPAHPLISRLIQRKARDANGVADGAEAAVGAAASSSGHALPGAVMRKFEDSLGADLSSVRVHTGAASQTAAEAVGARAYTIGQDIHFGTGQYDPSSPAGQHLLAHEVAHTVQQAGGAPHRQHKLEVSAPGDAHELEADRAADAMIAGATAAIGPGGGVARAALWRDADKDKGAAPNPGPPPETPFDAAKLPPGAIAAIDKVAIDSVRAMAIGAIGHAYSGYLNACDQVSAKLTTEKKAREDQEKEWVTMAIGAAGLLLGPVGAAVGAKLAGPALQQGLVAEVEQALPRILAKEGTDMQTRQGITDAVIKQIASERVTALMAKLTPEAATGLVGKAATATAGVVAKIDVRGQKEDKALSYVEALKNAGDVSSSSLQTACGTCTDLGALIGVHAQFAAATVALYKTEIDMKAHNFMTQIATTIGAKGNGSDGNNEVVVINAYGQDRLANVHYLSDSANYTFHSWITPDMESTARGLNASARRISPAQINGHLPEPMFEGAVQGQEQVFQVEAWGKRRLVVCKSDKGFFSTNYGEIHFVRWVAADGEAAAHVKAGGQIGGLKPIDAGRIQGLQKPKDDPPEQAH